MSVPALAFPASGCLAGCPPPGFQSAIRAFLASCLPFFFSILNIGTGSFSPFCRSRVPCRLALCAKKPPPGPLCFHRIGPCCKSTRGFTAGACFAIPLFCFNQPVFAVFAAVYDVRMICFRIGVNEEVVAQKVHLQHCFFTVHRF